VIPTNLYGPDDNYDPTQSHVMAALIQKFHHAKTSNQRSVALWGTGTPRRDLMYVDDAAEAALVAISEYQRRDYLNIGTGHDHTIRELAEIVKSVIGYDGDIEFDASHPDGAPRKMLDASRILALGWTPAVDLRRGIELAYEWYRQSGKVS
jgi:GDP-L-fucose synthase